MVHSAITFHPEAAREAEEARDWYRDRSPGAAEGFLAELGNAVSQVTAAPRRWPRYKAGTRRYIFRRFPYSLVYKVSEDVVRVLAVAHDSRRADFWVLRSSSE